jgi:3-hydroxyacyl-CoA dehydrogenase
MSDLRVGVIGAGVMGSGIAQTLAQAGYETVGFDTSAEAVDKAGELVRAGRYGFDRAVARGKLDRADADAALDRLSFTNDLDQAVAAADLVVECVPEDLALKLEVFRDLDRRAPDGAILASNTSGFPATAIAAVTERPESVLVWHWASPPPVMKFAEIVRGPKTSDAAVELVCGVATACGKNPIVVKDSPMHWGFVANRIYGAMLREAGAVVGEGVASREQVNQLMVDCFNWPVGPYAMIKGATSGWKE